MAIACTSAVHVKRPQTTAIVRDTHETNASALGALCEVSAQGEHGNSLLCTF